MFNHDWKKELFTIPNCLSLFRLLLIPVYIHIYQNASQPLDYYLAGTILGISCLTDLADGKIARKFHMVTYTGKLLDPLADKVTQLTLITTLVGKYATLSPVLALFLVKETFQLVTLLVFAHQGKALPGALFAGKLCTTVLFVSLLLLVLFPRLNTDVTEFLVILDLAFLLYAFLKYLQAYFGKNPKIRDLNSK